MSVAIQVEYEWPAPDRPQYLPVASEGTFSHYWMPAARALGCVFVPMFQYGVPVSREDLPEVVREFERLRDYFAGACRIDEAILPHLRDRSERVVAFLASLDPSEVKDLFIG